MTPAQDEDAGFTLVEMLVTLALLAVLTALLTTGISGLRALSSAGAVTSEDLAPVEGYMRRVLTQMRPLPLDAERPQVLLDARNDGLTFVTSYASAGVHGGLARITWQLAPTATEGRYQLEEIRSAYRPTKAGKSAPVRTILIADIAGFALTYASTRQSDLTTWTTPAVLPTLINLDVAFAKNDRRRRLRFAVAVAGAVIPPSRARQ